MRNVLIESLGKRPANELETLIREAVESTDQLISNFRITRCHFLLSQALENAIGDNAGANFHSWAVWGSRKAGVTIRQEDRDQASRDATIVAAMVGGIVGLTAGYLFSLWAGLALWVSISVWVVIGMFTGGCSGYKLAGYTRSAAARLVLEGNRLVLDDIGGATAQFLKYASQNPDAHDAEDFNALLHLLRASESAKGDRDLLCRAFIQYEAARIATSDSTRHQASYFANCLAILHEHIRLQPYISRSMPMLIRKCVTQRLMTFSVGEETLAVHEDVPPLEDVVFPETLQNLTDDELLEFLNGTDQEEGWDTAKGDLMQTATSDWTQLSQRMGYIVNLFRSRHLDDGVRGCPYSEEQLADIGRGQHPAKPW